MDEQSRLLLELEHYRLEADRYRMLVEQSTDMISRHTPTSDWTYIDVNQAVESMLGYLPEEIIGTAGYDLFHFEDADNLHERADSVRYHNGMYINTYRYRHKMGHYIWMETTSRTIRNATGEPQEIVCVSRDVTDRVLAQQSMQRFARVVEAASDLVIFCDYGTQKMTYFNESAQQILGVPVENGSARYLSQLFEPEIARYRLQKALEEADKNEGWYGSLPLQLPHSDLHAEIEEIIAHRDSHDKTEYYTLIGRNNTLKRQAEEEAKQYQKEMAHMSRFLSVGEMATGLAHELNQPLATILNYCRGAQRRLENDGNATEMVSRAFDMISTQALRAAEIIKRMRSFLRKADSHHQHFSINDACTDVCQLLNHEIEDHNIDLSLQLAVDEPTLFGDKIQIEQVVLNLLRNAIEAHQCNDNPHRKVIIASSIVDREVQVLVSDNAGGISSADLGKLFEPFFTSKSMGLGMGLPISRTIIESHGGRLWAEIDENASSHFYLRLPCRGQ
ncbi:putative TWO COMPONENT HISTIDINE KINASE [Vibrio nigripulchritudo SFn27]|uniref:histidine kinase n=1 Tax=Vibrio nigripulchritudo TaxID=28173 RepID=U4KDZ2_9VIBR|nr:PAS domain S-box protein [Vibrio nigripulchritudo]CCN83824.1 putative TWO COMPONENT HISTIDINE KINASE [Vibrio nigripulchritudo BLFn1]CCN87168.1 putative TWO COMPONENT HISTIDINE KINASE [Vibrio nigripulchritudo SFn27]CCN94524.1 putative TWO COMPONENT HISTIDINE KINASE [Vibrio nigripulchritudo ENn2]CCO40910.1 putative TWO COMPONENT HISTIDINE KINASE [Vibrio nigripulchritudo SFn135]CCO54989.1 putative TWO COMPONENT HISTIDINE KINASE [Vibrio nigripulchritudo Wn13]